MLSQDDYIFAARLLCHEDVDAVGVADDSI